MTMYSRSIESSRSNSPRRTIDESVLDAIDLLKHSVEKRESALAEVPEFRQLAISIDINFPSLRDDSFECHKCGELFTHEEAQRKHMRDLHGGASKGYACPICQKTFNSTGNLQAHKSRDHSSLSDIKFCPFCNLEVLESIHMHNKTNHPHACFGCKTDFQTPRERALHDGAIHHRKYICHTCWRTFIEKTHLIQHQIDSHTVYCRTCIPHKSFASSQALEAHYTAKHMHGM